MQDSTQKKTCQVQKMKHSSNLKKTKFYRFVVSKTIPERLKSKIKILFITGLGLVGALTLLRIVLSPTALVARVIDGDTIKLSNGKVVRYIGIDTPEMAKGQTPAGCFAQEATEMNRQLVEGKQVKIKTDKNEMDNFGRTLAYVYLDEIFVNQYLLEQGAGKFQLDTVNIQHSPVLAAAAQKAHQEKAGLWSKCAPTPELGCQVKGNLDRLDKRWYHLPAFRHYEQTVVNLEHGDQWFCTEAEAEKAGFQKARE